MKNLKQVTAAALLLLVLSCSTEENDIITTQDETADLAGDIYATSSTGIYNGVFTTLEGTERGSMEITIPADDGRVPQVILSFSSGTEVILEASSDILYNASISNLVFESDQTSLEFSVEANGSSPKITNIILNNKEGSALVGKHTNRAPVIPIPGTYLCTDCGTHPVLDNTVEQSFNILAFVDIDGTTTFDTEVTLGTTVFAGTGSQESCTDNGTETICGISGSFSVDGAPITWDGFHTFNNEASGPNDCSGVSGNWTFASINFGTITGSFVSDDNCNPEFTLYTENFDNFTGSGFASMPAAGQLDSDIVIANGFSFGSLAYGGTQDQDDYARGLDVSGGVSTGGIYAFDVDGAGEIALGVQPIGSDFTPGEFEFRIQNVTGFALSNFTISYDLWVNNDQGRANSLNFSYSTDGITFTDVSALDFTSDETADTDGFTKTEQNGTFSASVPLGSFIYFRFNGNDETGSNSRDEFAIDNITLTGN